MAHMEMGIYPTNKRISWGNLIGILVMYWESMGYTTNNIRYWCVWKLDRPSPCLVIPTEWGPSQYGMDDHTTHNIFLFMARMLKLCFDVGFGFHKMMVFGFVCLNNGF